MRSSFPNGLDVSSSEMNLGSCISEATGNCSSELMLLRLIFIVYLSLNIK